MMPGCLRPMTLRLAALGALAVLAGLFTAAPALAHKPSDSYLTLKLADGEPISNTQGAVDIWSLISQAMFDKSSTGQPSEPQAQ